MVKLYTTSRVKKCPFCEMVKKFLHKHNVEYQEIDAAVEREAWNEMFKKTKKLIFPQLLIGEITIVGWLPPEQEYKILDLLKENKIDFEK